MAAALLALLAWFFTPPDPGPIKIDVPAKYIPGVKRTVAEAVQGMYLLGMVNGAPLWIIVGIGASFLLQALLRLLAAHVAFVRRLVAVLDALLPLLRSRSSDPPP